MTDDLITYDALAESSTIAACLMSRTARDEAKRHIGGLDFFDQRHQHIWEAMSQMDRESRPVDASSVRITLQAKSPNAAALLPELVTWPAMADNVGEYAETVRGWAVRRRLYNLATMVHQKVMKPDAETTTLAATIANEFAAVRDSGITSDAESLTLGELLDDADEEPDWLVPGLLERRDRLMLTGEEGLGKSYLLRQIAIMSAAGLDPFDMGKRIKPISVLIVDCENSLRQVRRKVRPVVAFAQKHGLGHPENVNLLCSKRIDITADRDLARIHRELDACQPDMVIIGPLYRLVPRALQTDDEAAPVLAALDTIRDRDISLLIEAHAGHAIGRGGVRDLRPRGSSALLGWPEFGYGMRQIAGGYADVVPWRGDRDERNWPDRLRHASDGIRWIPVDGDWQPPMEENRWAS